MQDDLAPTLWRTCRTLANRMRLRVLAVLLTTERLNVTDTARRSGLPLSDTSQRLRDLQARGLLSVNRQGRCVFYRAVANPQVRHAAAILAALRPALRTGEPGEPAAIRALTAFTHPRRIALVRALAAGHARPVELTTVCALSYPSLRRHLRKLARRGLLTEERGRYALARPCNSLARALLTIALE